MERQMATMTLEEFVSRHPDAVRVAPGTEVTVQHRVYTVFGSGGVWSQLHLAGEPALVSRVDAGDNGFVGHHVSSYRLSAGDAVYAAHGDSIGEGRTFFSAAFYAAPEND